MQKKKKEEILLIENRASWDSGWSMKAKSSLFFTIRLWPSCLYLPGKRELGNGVKY